MALFFGFNTTCRATKDSLNKNQIGLTVAHISYLKGSVGRNFQAWPDGTIPSVNYKDGADFEIDFTCKKKSLLYSISLSTCYIGYTIFNYRKYVTTPFQVSSEVIISQKDFFVSLKPGLGIRVFKCRKIALVQKIYFSEAILSFSKYDENLPDQYVEQESHLKYYDLFSRHGIGTCLSLELNFRLFIFTINNSIEYYFASRFSSSWKSTFYSVGVSLVYKLTKR